MSPCDMATSLEEKELNPYSSDLGSGMTLKLCFILPTGHTVLTELPLQTYRKIGKGLRNSLLHSFGIR